MDTSRKIDALRNLARNFANFPPKHVDPTCLPPNALSGASKTPPLKRAAVGAILRIRPRKEDVKGAESHPFVMHAAATEDSCASFKDVERFLELPWVQRGTPEVLFIKRANRSGDRWSGHVAFPGGKQEPNEKSLETAGRETREEIGLDLKKGYMLLGELDERRIETTLGGKLIMLLSTFVFLQTTPKTPTFTLSEVEVASAHWVPIRYFLDQIEQQNTLSYSKRLFSNRVLEPVSHDILMTAYPAARHWPSLIRNSLQRICGKMYFWSIELPSGNNPLEEETTTTKTEHSFSAMRNSANSVAVLSDDVEEEQITLIMESSDDEVISMSDDDGEYLARLTSEREGRRIVREPSQGTAVAQTGFPPSKAAPSINNEPPKYSIPSTGLTLWGLTLSVTSELMDMMHPPANVPIVPLRGSHPVFDWWEVNQMLSFANWVAETSSERRKPGGHVVPSRRKHPHHHFHVSPSITIPVAFALGAIGRIVVIVFGVREVWKGGRQLIKAML